MRSLLQPVKLRYALQASRATDKTTESQQQKQQKILIFCIGDMIGLASADKSVETMAGLESGTLSLHSSPRSEGCIHPWRSDSHRHRLLQDPAGHCLSTQLMVHRARVPWSPLEPPMRMALTLFSILDHLGPLPQTLAQES